MDKPYLLLTPGPLTTTSSVKASMLTDWCTWDTEYKEIVQEIRAALLRLAGASPEDYTAVPMQGSGTFGVEAAVGTAVPEDGRLLILANGAYGQRIGEIADVLRISHRLLESPPDRPTQAEELGEALREDPSITHVALVHCETTTGILNPLEALIEVIRRHGKISIVDAMSSFGGIPIDVQQLGIDYLVSSANKCIQGVPGFSFVLARTSRLEVCEGNARSLSLDLFDQWQVMEKEQGKWRYTSPTHTVRAFRQALLELDEEGGVRRRCARYTANQRTLVRVMRRAGFETHLPDAFHSPFITTFNDPDLAGFTFEDFYLYLKRKGFVIYPGKLSGAKVFRIGTIGDVHIEDIEELGEAAASYTADLLSREGEQQ
ncbi:2-aminoethylphosphonate--pyruvate transaminase [Saccharibacillus deserti]|uniref:2-aminoethylphosphonate--pyruvate transaminase n=1 Tax=Saccharibacillus deserti TaxID=1634444 RepID=UPI001556529E|nr:2-aminoethylphosphonate--pyruvate transaminase [Saccharibacillus deserti]